VDSSVASVIDLQSALTPEEFAPIGVAILAAKARLEINPASKVDYGRGTDHIFIRSLGSQELIDKVTTYITEAKYAALSAELGVMAQFLLCRRQYNGLKQLMGRCRTPTSLLSHEFFDLLQIEPVELVNPSRFAPELSTGLLKSKQDEEDDNPPSSPTKPVRMSARLLAKKALVAKTKWMQCIPVLLCSIV